MDAKNPMRASSNSTRSQLAVFEQGHDMLTNTKPDIEQLIKISATSGIEQYLHAAVFYTWKLDIVK
jgi:hypothetical protein